MAAVPPWTCPRCRRRFGRPGQSHECAPAMSLEEYFATGPPHERPVFEAVLAHLESLGPVIVEPVSVGIFLTRTRRIAELRPRTRWVALMLTLDRPVADARVSSRQAAGRGRTWHSIRLAGADDVDDAVRAWLTEAWEAAGD